MNSSVGDSSRWRARWLLGVLFVAAGLAVWPVERSDASERLIVGFRDGVEAAVRGETRRAVDAQVLRGRTGVDGMQVLRAPRGALARLRADDDVAWVERDVRVRAQARPVPAGWWLGRIAAPSAWETTRGDHRVTVAVLDTGLASGHPDFDANVWRNGGEIPGNGFDDDGNGFVDDVRGWDWVDGDADPRDRNGHGTHVAGIIAAPGDDGVGMTGTAGRVRVMPLRVLDHFGQGWASWIAEALAYAGRNGAQVANLSLGGGYTHAIAAAVEAYPEVLTVAAAGNEGVSAQDTYPCALPDAHVVCVGASDDSDALAEFSNSGASVDLAAPGTAIESAQPKWVTLFSERFATGLANWERVGAGMRVVPAPDGSGPSLSAQLTAGQDGVSALSHRVEVPLGSAGCVFGARAWIDGPGSVAVWAITDSGTFYPVADFREADSGKRIEQEIRVKVGFGEVPWGEWSRRAQFRVDISGAGHVTDIGLRCLRPTDPAGESFSTHSGTSMATAVVSGAAALVYSTKPDAAAADVKRALLAGVDPVPALAGKVATGGRLNAAKAVVAVLGDREPPPPVDEPSWTNLPEPLGWQPGDPDPTWSDATAEWPTGFGTLTPFGVPTVMAQPDRGVLVGATADVEFGLARFGADGRPDPGFGDAGRLLVPLPFGTYGRGSREARAVAPTPDGGVVLAGTRAADRMNDEGVLMWRRADGSPDPAETRSASRSGARLGSRTSPSPRTGGCLSRLVATASACACTASPRTVRRTSPSATTAWWTSRCSTACSPRPSTSTLAAGRSSRAERSTGASSRVCSCACAPTGRRTRRSGTEASRCCPTPPRSPPCRGLRSAPTSAYWWPPKV